MNATQQITSNAAVYLLDTISNSTIADYIGEALGEYATEHDVAAIEAEYREALDAILPEGASLAGEFVFAEVGTELDREALRESAAEIDFWAIVERHAI